MLAMEGYLEEALACLDGRDTGVMATYGMAGVLAMSLWPDDHAIGLGLVCESLLMDEAVCTGRAIVNELKEANLLLFGNTVGEVKLHNIVRGMVLCITHDHSKTWHGAVDKLKIDEVVEQKRLKGEGAMVVAAIVTPMVERGRREW